MAFQLPAGKLVDKYGCTKMLIASELFGVLTAAGWLASTGFGAFAALQIPNGFMAAMWVPAMNALVASSVTREERGEAIGRLSAFRGLVRFLSPYLGGTFYDLLGLPAVEKYVKAWTLKPSLSKAGTAK